MRVQPFRTGCLRVLTCTYVSSASFCGLTAHVCLLLTFLYLLSVWRSGVIRLTPLPFLNCTGTELPMLPAAPADRRPCRRLGDASRNCGCRSHPADARFQDPRPGAAEGPTAAPGPCYIAQSWALPRPLHPRLSLHKTRGSSDTLGFTLQQERQPLRLADTPARELMGTWGMSFPPTLSVSTGLAR